MKYLIVVLLIILVVLLLLISSFTNNIEGIDNKKNKWIILLTMYSGDDEDRKRLYTDSIKKWLDNTSYNIFVVESSGYTFPELHHDRLYVYSFSQGENVKSSSQGEANSIVKLLKNIEENKDYIDCSHILKVTGRYYLDNIEQVLNEAPQDKDLYLQIHRKDNWQNSEYFGIRKELMNDCVSQILDEGFMEKQLYQFSKDKDYVTIGPFKNNIRRGGDKLLISDL